MNAAMSLIADLKLNHAGMCKPYGLRISPLGISRLFDVMMSRPQRDWQDSKSCYLTKRRIMAHKILLV